MTQLIRTNETNSRDKQQLYSVIDDIASPLAILQISMDAIKEAVSPETWCIMNIAIKRIRGISGSLLPHRVATVGETNLIDIVQQVILEKRTEWMRLPCKINLECDANTYFINAEKIDIYRILSNLLNNAYESMRDSLYINLSLKYTKNFIIVGLQDIGCGIEEDKINQIMHGYSTKLNGHGIGLSHAVKYMVSIKGKLQIQSTVDVGTLVELFFPY